MITESGEQLGILTLREALIKAEEQGMDLVEIAPLAKPPVAKIIDYGKFRYHQTKREKDSKKAQVQIKVKEVKLKPNIDTHDFDTKVRHARDFLEKGNKVKVTCTFRGREMLHMELGQKIMRNFFDAVSDLSTVETMPKLMGRIITAVLVPSAKKVKASKPQGE